MPVLRAPAVTERFYWFCYSCGKGSGSTAVKADAEKSWKKHQEGCDVSPAE